jgi:DNA-binding response OmpR family regulator
MDGTIWVQSEEGQGSTFYISIPLELSDEDAVEEEVEIVPVVPASSQIKHDGEIFAPKILCVEDNRSMRDYLITELNDYQIYACEHGLQAIERLEEMSKNASLPDIIVSDIMMPGMDGFALAQHIRSTSKFSNIPIILLTARASHEDRLKGLRMGVDDYITKPFDVEELRVRIQNLIGRKPMKDEAIHAEGESIPSIDEKWLKTVEERIRLRLHERDFTLDDLADDLHMSRSQLYRRIKAYTGLTPHKYLKEVRLYRAQELLESSDADTIAQLSAAVGFEDASYFSRIYAERFGYRPGERL